MIAHTHTHTRTLGNYNITKWLKCKYIANKKTTCGKNFFIGLEYYSLAGQRTEKILINKLLLDSTKKLWIYFIWTRHIILCGSIHKKIHIYSAICFCHCATDDFDFNLYATLHLINVLNKRTAGANWLCYFLGFCCCQLQNLFNF